jgi:hypothetical protein
MLEQDFAPGAFRRVMFDSLPVMAYRIADHQAVQRTDHQIPLPFN